MKKIYIAGKLNDMAVNYIKNLSYMCKESEKVRKEGFSVYVPAIDFLLGAMNGDWEYEDYFNNSQPWLDSSDAIYVLPNWKTSLGTKSEIKRAKSKNIPIFFNLEDLIKWRNNLEDNNALHKTRKKKRFR